MPKQLDVLFIIPGESEKIYQELSKSVSAIEPPIWGMLLAQSCRAKGFEVAILDCNAERLSLEESAKMARMHDPRLFVFVVYGANPNAGTTMMTGATALADRLKAEYDYPICFIGSHMSALPLEVLNSHKSIDFVCYNEGVYALQNLLKTDFATDLQNVKGIGWRDNGVARLNDPERVVPNELMDVDLPGYAWDLLPYKNKPFDLYRSSNWHANFDENKRSPYMAMYTSLGCQKKCTFCMINSINRQTADPNYHAGMSNTMRFWSPKFMADQIEKFHELGVSTIKIADEMHLLNKKYYAPLHEELINRGIGKNLQMWAYSRIDTVNVRFLENVRKAGITWLALGVEAASERVRSDITKGKFDNTNIREVIKQINDFDINVISNYIFGLPEDNFETMNETLDLACELNTEMANMYSAAALPGSELHLYAKQNNIPLPDSYEAWSFHSYECLPLPTKYLSAAEVLRFRDKAWDLYFKQPKYLDKIEKKFGTDARKNIEETSKIKLKRKILGD